MAMMSIYDYDMQKLSIMFDYTLFADILAWVSVVFDSLNPAL